MAARALACAALLAALARADEASHIYAASEGVTLWYSKVGPYHNPQETYSVYALPFCRPAKPIDGPTTRIGEWRRGGGGGGGGAGRGRGRGGAGRGGARRLWEAVAGEHGAGASTC